MKQSTLNTIGIIALTIILVIPAGMGCYFAANMGSGGGAYTTTTTAAAATAATAATTAVDSLQIELDNIK